MTEDDAFHNLKANELGDNLHVRLISFLVNQTKQTGRS